MNSRRRRRTGGNRSDSYVSMILSSRSSSAVFRANQCCCKPEIHTAAIKHALTQTYAHISDAAAGRCHGENTEYSGVLHCPAAYVIRVARRHIFPERGCLGAIRELDRSLSGVSLQSALCALTSHRYEVASLDRAPGFERPGAWIDDRRSREFDDLAFAVDAGDIGQQCFRGDHHGVRGERFRGSRARPPAPWASPPMGGRRLSTGSTGSCRT